MTKEKKFRRRVRRRMRETGERYTEARAAEGGGTEAVARRLLAARDGRGGLPEVMAAVNEFAQEHPRSDAGALAAHVLELLWPREVPFGDFDEETHREREDLTRGRLVELLARWAEGRDVEMVSVIEAAFRLPVSAPADALRHALVPVGPAGNDEVPDESYYDHGAEPPGEGDGLGDVWETAPDVSHAFGLPSGTHLGRPWSPEAEQVRDWERREMERLEAEHRAAAEREREETLTIQEVVRASLPPRATVRAPEKDRPAPGPSSVRDGAAQILEAWRRRDAVAVTDVVRALHGATGGASWVPACTRVLDLLYENGDCSVEEVEEALSQEEHDDGVRLIEAPVRDSVLLRERRWAEGDYASWGPLARRLAEDPDAPD